MLGLFITVTAWGALALSISGLVVMLRHPRRTVLGQPIGVISTILIALGLILRAETPIYLPLTFVGCALAFLAVVFLVRGRGA